MGVFVYNKSNFFGVVDIYGFLGDHMKNLSNFCPLGGDFVDGNTTLPFCSYQNKKVTEEKMAGVGFDPGGRTSAPSYAQRVKKNVQRYKKLDRNVLIICIEKKNQDDIIYLAGEQVASVCGVVGFSVTSDTQGY